MIRVAVAGSSGRMGNAVCKAVNAADDLLLVCGIDPSLADTEATKDIPVYSSVQEALSSEAVDVMVDFTRPDVASDTVLCALNNGVNVVLGTTGLSTQTLKELSAQAVNDACLFYAPNFTTGAVLMMQFAKAAAPYFPQAEIIEYHHCRKKDAPSGTAVTTAHMISDARGGTPSDAPGAETEIEGAKGARGALIDGIPVHSIRSNGYVANQEVIFGSLGQTLSIHHISWDTQSYMPGVLLGIRESIHCSGLIVGLENFMQL